MYVVTLWTHGAFHGFVTDPLWTLDEAEAFVMDPPDLYRPRPQDSLRIFELTEEESYS